MSLGAALYSLLSGTLSVSDRVYPLTLPQNVTLPAVTYQVVSELPVTTHELQQGHPLYEGRKAQETRIQFNSYGGTFDASEALSDELLTALMGFRGPSEDVQIESVIPALALDDYDPDTNTWRRIDDVFVLWQPIPGS